MERGDPREIQKIGIDTQLDEIEPLISRRVEVPLTLSLKGPTMSFKYPRFIDGERRARPEDVGGPSGFQELLNVMAKPRHAQHREFERWYGGRFDPEDLSVGIIQERVAKIARRRTLGKAGFAKSQNEQH